MPDVSHYHLKVAKKVGESDQKTSSETAGEDDHCYNRGQGGSRERQKEEMEKITSGFIKKGANPLKDIFRLDLPSDPAQIC